MTELKTPTLTIDQKRDAFLDGLLDTYFAPTEEEFAKFNAIATEANALGTKILSNIDLSKGSEAVPENYGLYIGGIRKRKEGVKGEGMLQLGMFIYAVPAPEFIIENHPDFVAKAILKAYHPKIRVATTPNKTGEIVASAPLSVADFIEERERGEGLKTFRELAPDVVTHLKKSGLRNITTDILRQCLMSEQFAHALYGKSISGKGWDTIVKSMVILGERAGKKVEILQNWLETRHQVTAEEAQNVDLSAFDALVEQDDEEVTE